MSSTTFRPATAEEAEALGLRLTGWLWVIEDSDGIAAHGGVVLNGAFQAIFHMEDRARNYPRTLAKALTTVRKKIGEVGCVYALEDPEQETAYRLLKWFGFVPIGLVGQQVLYKWIG